MKSRKLLACVLALVMLCGISLTASAQTVAELPRNETLYFAGQQWGSVNSWNVIGTNQNNAMASPATPADTAPSCLRPCTCTISWMAP